ncbi:kinetoplast DNA-associated protein [Angomonas deanei]|uniref:Uncharacterized protein n=1 Tax=Angomonas deanei TaxID=59799 RepID=A0A7G2CI50_9TRYP|nr:kinetoplast DNA-associated protein [Angomonas deanei]CAD2218594.1 hypothetical protein, conserved [Angomonas deanei]|eukprot:EPY22771.1 kinetoplast DNA-associated protein [Angomonas deanei]
MNGFNIFVKELAKKNGFKGPTSHFTQSSKLWSALTPAKRAAYERKAKAMPPSARSVLYQKFRKQNWSTVSHLPSNKRVAAITKKFKAEVKAGNIVLPPKSAKTTLKKASKAVKKAAKPTKKSVKPTKKSIKPAKKSVKKTVKKSKK